MKYESIYIEDGTGFRELEKTQFQLKQQNGFITTVSAKQLIELLNEKTDEIWYLTDELEALGKRVCPECGEVHEEGELIWDEKIGTYLCAECVKNKEEQ